MVSRDLVSQCAGDTAYHRSDRRALTLSGQATDQGTARSAAPDDRYGTAHVFIAPVIAAIIPPVVIVAAPVIISIPLPVVLPIILVRWPPVAVVPLLPRHRRHGRPDNR